MAENRNGILAALLAQQYQQPQTGGVLNALATQPVTANRNMLAQALRARTKPEFQMKETTPQGILDAAALATSPVPILGDLAGIGADAYRFATDPGSRNWLNYGLAALGALPMVPAMSLGLNKLAQSQGKTLGALPAGPGRNQAGAIGYHGSPKEFDFFDINAPKSTSGAFNKYGISISPNEKVAQRYASDFSEGGKHGFLYKVDFSPKKELSLANKDFHTLQRYIGDIDAGKQLNEVQQITLEDMLNAAGIKYKYGDIHPMEAIKSSGYDSISSVISKPGSMAEAEKLIFDPKAIKILEKKQGGFK